MLKSFEDYLIRQQYAGAVPPPTKVPDPAASAAYEVLEDKYMKRTKELTLLQQNLADRNATIKELTKTKERLHSDIASLKQRLLAKDKELNEHKTIDQFRSSHVDQNHNVLAAEVSSLSRKLSLANKTIGELRTALHSQDEGAHAGNLNPTAAVFMSKHVAPSELSSGDFQRKLVDLGIYRWGTRTDFLSPAPAEGFQPAHTTAPEVGEHLERYPTHMWQAQEEQHTKRDLLGEAESKATLISEGIGTSELRDNPSHVVAPAGLINPQRLRLMSEQAPCKASLEEGEVSEDASSAETVQYSASAANAVPLGAPDRRYSKVPKETGSLLEYSVSAQEARRTDPAAEDIEANEITEETGSPAVDKAASETKVLVTNLPYDLQEERVSFEIRVGLFSCAKSIIQLLEIFADYNPSSAKLILRSIPRSLVRDLSAHDEPHLTRSFGFVTLASEDMQKRACEEMNGRWIDGHELRVKAAIDGPGREGTVNDAPVGIVSPAGESTPNALPQCRAPQRDADPAGRMIRAALGLPAEPAAGEKRKRSPDGSEAIERKRVYVKHEDSVDENVMVDLETMIEQEMIRAKQELEDR